MVADEVAGEEVVDVGAVDCVTDVFADSGEDYFDSFFVAGFDEDLEVVEAGGVDEGDASHPDYSDDGAFVGGDTHHFVKFCGGSEEEGAVDFVYGYAWGEVEEFVAVCVGFGSEVELLAVDADCGVFRDAAEEDEDCEEHSDFDCDREVEDDCEKECNYEDPDVAFGVGEDSADSPPAGHVVADHDEDSGETCHGDKVDEGHGEEEDEEEDDGVDDTGDGCAAAVGDVGHCAGDSACDGDSAEDGDDHVGYALADEFGVGVCSAAGDAVSDCCAEEGFYSAEHGDCEGGGEEEVD